MQKSYTRLISIPPLKKGDRGGFASQSVLKSPRTPLCQRGVVKFDAKRHSKNDSSVARLLALFSLFLLLTPLTSTAQRPPKVSVAYAAISPIFAGVWMAKEIGAFEKHGLKSELVYISSGSITVQAMVGGNLDMSRE